MLRVLQPVAHRGLDPTAAHRYPAVVGPPMVQTRARHPDEAVVLALTSTSSRPPLLRQGSCGADTRRSPVGRQGRRRTVAPGGQVGRPEPAAGAPSSSTTVRSRRSAPGAWAPVAAAGPRTGCPPSVEPRCSRGRCRLRAGGLEAVPGPSRRENPAVVVHIGPVDGRGAAVAACWRRRERSTGAIAGVAR